MPFDGFSVQSITQELNHLLVNSRIDKIHQPDKEEIVFSVRTPHSGTVRLVISANARWSRVHLTSEKRPNPSHPSSFCMLLRKYLEGGKIKEIRQVDFERIVHITIEALDEFRDWKPRLLICEFMGKHSNIILINPETNLIIDAIKRYGSEVSSYREVFPAREYVAPPDQGKVDPRSLGLEDFAARMWACGSKSMAQALFEICSGVSPTTSRELCHLAGLDPDLPVDQCGEYELSLLLDRLHQELQMASAPSVTALVVYDRLRVLDFTPLPLARVHPDLNMRVFESVNQAADCFYQTKLNEIRLESFKTNLARSIKVWMDKSQKKRLLQEGDLNRAEEKEQLRIWGELITAYAYQLEKGRSEITLEDFFTGHPVTIPMDPRLTPIENAQKYFKSYNKSRSAIRHLHHLLAQTIQEAEYLDSVLVAVNQTDTIDQLDEIIEELENTGYLRERSKKEKTGRHKSTPRRFHSSDGLEILVGRNNRQNDQLTLKTADRHDLWLHTRQIPGSHVIIRLPRSISTIHDVPHNSLEEAALLAAYYSKARQDDKVAVDYTFRSNVRKPSGGKPGMVIYDHYWTLYTTPGTDRLSALLLQSELRDNDSGRP